MCHVFKNTQFCLLCIVVLSVLEFNLCSSFFCQSRWGLWMMALFHPRSQGHIFKVKSWTTKFNFLFGMCSLFIQCLKVENMLSSQVTLLILGFCTGPKKWSHTFMSLLTTTKNPKWGTSSLTSIFFSMMEFTKDFVIKLITEDLTHFNCNTHWTKIKTF